MYVCMSLPPGRGGEAKLTTNIRQSEGAYRYEGKKEGRREGRREGGTDNLGGIGRDERQGPKLKKEGRGKWEEKGGRGNQHLRHSTFLQNR